MIILVLTERCFQRNKPSTCSTSFLLFFILFYFISFFVLLGSYLNSHSHPQLRVSPLHANFDCRCSTDKYPEELFDTIRSSLLTQHPKRRKKWTSLQPSATSSFTYWLCPCQAHSLSRIRWPEAKLLLQKSSIKLKSTLKETLPLFFSNVLTKSFHKGLVCKIWLDSLFVMSVRSLTHCP